MMPVKSTVEEAPGKDATPKPKSRPRKKLDPRKLVEKAYKKVDEKLEKGEESSKAIDDLVKLMKLEKDLGEEQTGVKEIKVRWQESEESSSEG